MRFALLPIIIAHQVYNARLNLAKDTERDVQVVAELERTQ